MHVQRASAMPRLFGSDFVDQLMNGLDDRRQRVFIAGEDHPAGQRARAFLVEGVESEVHHFARAAQPGAAGADRVDDRVADRPRQMSGKRLLQPRGRTEMMQQIGMRTPDPRPDRL